MLNEPADLAESEWLSAHFDLVKRGKRRVPVTRAIKFHSDATLTGAVSLMLRCHLEADPIRVFSDLISEFAKSDHGFPSPQDQMRVVVDARSDTT